MTHYNHTDIERIVALAKYVDEFARHDELVHKIVHDGMYADTSNATWVTQLDFHKEGRYSAAINAYEAAMSISKSVACQLDDRLLHHVDNILIQNDESEIKEERLSDLGARALGMGGCA